MAHAPWPPLPDIALECIAERVESTPGFLELRRRRQRCRHPDGRVSREFVYDSVGRRALDAVVIAAHALRDGETLVYLRSAIRPPVTERSGRLAIDEAIQSVHFWELPAGLVEPEEEDAGGLKRCAARETREELGFDIDAARFLPLGLGIYPAPGVIAERQFFFRVEVEPERQLEPDLDGSPLEEAGVVFATPLERALEACRRGLILDGKTELGLRRLHEALGER